LTMERSDFRGVPRSPGVYIFRDSADRPLYVGKAVDLRKRVEQHFSGNPHDAREAMLREQSKRVEHIVTRNEVEALILENNLIKRFRPPLNVMLKDDKSYPYIRITGEEFPRVMLTRRPADDGSSYFGPYTSPTAARLTIKHLRKVFPIRSCSLELDGEKTFRPCLDYHIKICSAPCAGLITKGEYAKLVNGFAGVLRGKHKSILASLYRSMEEASSLQRYEEAAILRDRIVALEKLSERQYAQLPGWADYDVVAAKGDTGCVLHFRKGALIGREVFRLRVPGGISSPDLLSEFVQLFYSSGRTPANTVLVHHPLDRSTTSWLRAKNPVCSVRPPSGSLERTLLEMCYANLPALTKEEALRQLGDLLGIRSKISVIQGFDVSNLGPSNPYVSAVCFKEGEPHRRDYRVYRIKWTKGQNDFAMLEEVVLRHAKHLRRGEVESPDLILIDGGPAQLEYAQRALRIAKLKVPVISLAKKEEMVHTVEGERIRLAHTDDALHVLQHVRDEAHRFALIHHRRGRRRISLKSALQEVRGLGRVKSAKILERYPTIGSLKKATVEDLSRVPGVSQELAQRVRAALDSL
jgi:excinuclease ABC subunit C